MLSVEPWENLGSWDVCNECMSPYSRVVFEHWKNIGWEETYGWVDHGIHHSNCPTILFKKIIYSYVKWWMINYILVLLKLMGVLFINEYWTIYECFLTKYKTTGQVMA